MRRITLSLFMASFVILCIWQLVANHTSKETKMRAKDYAMKAKEYCKQNGYRTDYCFLVDFDVHSGKNRFFVWDFEKEKIVYRTICVHGHGGGSTYEKPVLSNKPGSKCSSEGRYKIGRTRRMNSHPNMHCIEVDGLDPTCSNARRRAILIHPSAWQFATYPIPIMWRTAGCFGTSLRAFRKLDEYKNMSNKPMLLWAYK